MKATILGINLNIGRAIARTDDGEYVLIELFTDEPELHDIVQGNFEMHPLGGETLRNISSESTMDVYIQDYCNQSVAESYLAGY